MGVKDKSNEENDKSQHTFLTLDEDIFVQNNLALCSHFLSPFLSSLERLISGGLGLHHHFSPLLSTKHPITSFLFLFSLLFFFSNLLKIHSTKHTLSIALIYIE